MQTMFLRFYGTSEKQIDRCLKDLEPYLTYCVDIKHKPLTQSMNYHVLTSQNTEVLLTFKSASDCSTFKSTPATRDIYMKYASTIAGATFSERKQGDPCFKSL